MTITVYGMPGAQGSKRHVGRGVMIEMSKKVAPWRQDVVAACKASTCFVMTEGPLQVSLTFTLIKPKSAPKKRIIYPDRTPDVDKLCRSTLDALKTAGAIEDDARVVELTAAKRYPNEGRDALSSPGCVIHIRSVLELTA